MPENKTQVVVQAKAQGFQELQQQSAKLVEAASKATSTQAQGFTKLAKGGKAYRQEIKALEADLKSLTKTQIQVTKALMGVEKGSTIFKQLKENLKNVNAEVSRLQSVKDKTQALFGPKGVGGHPLTDKDMARGGFIQGLAQGGLHMDLQRGPGMWRQAAGQAVGNMGRGFAAAPFGGVQGMQQGLAGIPIAGGFMAGQFGTAMGFGEQALNVQQTRLDAMHLFGGGKEIAGMSGIDKRLQQATAAASQIIKRPMGDEDRAREREAQQQYLSNDWVSQQVKSSRLKFSGSDEEWANLEPTVRRQEEERSQDSERQRHFREAAERGSDINEYLEVTDHTAIKKARAKAAAERGRPFDEVRKVGQQYGMAEPEAIQAVSTMLQRSGGHVGEAQKQGMIPAMFAAQKLYGVGADTSGSFLGAGRTGGMVGAEGRGADALADSIGDALSIGLEGSEVTEYLSQMASGIEAWKTSGIPINSRSIANLSGTFANLGMGSVRGAAMGKQFGAAAQKLTQTGPQDAIDLMMLQTVGGYQGGGADSYMEALKKLENLGGEGGIGTPEAQEMIKKLVTAGGGGSTGVLTMREAFGRKGMQMGVSEAELVAKSAMNPESLSEAERAKIAKINEKMMEGQENAPQGAAGLAKQGADLMGTQGGAIARRAAIENKQAGIGGQMLPTLQNLQNSSANISQAFSTLSSGPLTDVSKQFLAFTKALEGLSKSISEGGDIWNSFSKIVTGHF